MTGPDADDPDGLVLTPRAVVRLLVVLAAASGCLDVFCLARLNGFFASVITGNLVQSRRVQGPIYPGRPIAKAE